VAERLRPDPTVRRRARARVDSWFREHAVAAVWARGWDELLGRPVDAPSARLVEDSEATRALRQVTPFAGVVGPRERFRIWRETVERG
jgi:hypothetical protein